MSKKYTLILTVAILGLLTAGAMWFVTSRSVSTTYPGTMMGGRADYDDMPMMRGEVATDMMIEPSSMVSSKMAPYPMMYGNDALSVSDRSVQKFSSHTLVVSDVAQYLQQMKEYFANNGGVVLSYNQGTSSRGQYGYLNVKVPINTFDQAVNEVSKDAKKVIDENITSNDITGQVVSIADRIQQLQDEKAIQEAALIDATTAIEKQKIELEIARLDRQIQQMQQNQETVKDQVDYATMSISVSNKESYFNYDGPRPITDVFREAWWSLRSTANSLVSFLIWTVVYAIVWVPVLLLARWIWGKVRSKANNTTSKK